MTTVKEFRDFGVEFVAGDKCRDAILVFAEGWYVYGNINNDSFDSCKVSHFAWRPLNTLPDNQKFKYEVDIDAHSWRPLLEQSVKPDNKPVFTQEMADIQYELGLHKANSELLATLTNFMVKNNIGKIGESCIDVAIRELSEKYNIDTRTPKQKAVDELTAFLLSRPVTIDSRGTAEMLYAAGYEKKC